tara:strand:+ start:582 stop:857 length:276 start_codon:yes stop_codon:yes gene_type:complete
MGHLDFEIHSIKDNKVEVQTYGFGTWHLNELEKALKKDKTGIISCLWDFMKRIEVNEQYLQYMTARGMPPKEWVGILPKMTLTEEGFLVKE